MFLVLLFFCSPVDAQAKATRKFKAGDNVLCYHNTAAKLLPAKVLSVVGSVIEIEYEYEGEKHVEKVERELLIFAWETRAISRVRMWRDESGQFQIEAAAVGLDLEKNEILLHRIDNDAEIAVPTGRLGPADRDFIAKLAKEIEKQGPRISEVEKFELLPVPSGLVWAIADSYELDVVRQDFENKVKPSDIHRHRCFSGALPGQRPTPPRSN